MNIKASNISAILEADAHLSNCGLPTYSQVISQLMSVRGALQAGGMKRPKDWEAQISRVVNPVIETVQYVSQMGETA